MTDEMMLIDVTGKEHPISKYNTGWILGAGWIFFGVSFGFHCIFYKIHPSATDISLGAIKRRLFSGEEGGWPDNEERSEREDNEGDSGAGIPLLERLREQEQERAEEAGEDNEEDGSEISPMEKLRNCFSCCKKKQEGTIVEGNHDDGKFLACRISLEFPNSNFIRLWWSSASFSKRSLPNISVSSSCSRRALRAPRACPRGT